MRSTLGLVAALVALAGMAATNSQSEGATKSTTPKHCVEHPHPAAEEKTLEKRVFALANWESPAPGKGAISTMERLRGCVKAKHRPAMAKSWQDAKRRVYLEHDYRSIAPYPGYVGQGYWLRFLPIPRGYIDIETNGAFGDAKWEAFNLQGSGACGPAQLLGHGQPCPAMTDHERLTYWRITRSLWLEQGCAPWVCEAG